MKTSFTRLLVCLTTTTLLTACGKGFDRTPDVSSFEKYKETIAQAAKEATPSEIEAYDWAVSDLAFESLKTKYPGKSYRQIALAELDSEIKSDQDNIGKLEALKAQYDPIVVELLKVKAEVTQAGPTKNFFGDQFSIQAKVTNGSQFDYAQITWEALLYIDGSKEPVARAELIDGYDSENGLRINQTKSRSFQPDAFFSKDWVTLAVKNAKTRQVELGIIGAKDFNNKDLMDGAPYTKLEKTKKALENAKKYKEVLKG